jgi:hypothetical protein
MPQTIYQMPNTQQKVCMKPKAFWLHYNKPASRLVGRPRLTIHYNGKCHIVSHIVCMVPTWSRHRKQQPCFVMCGKGKLSIENDMAVIS